MNACCADSQGSEQEILKMEYIRQLKLKSMPINEYVGNPAEQGRDSINS